MSLKFTFKQFSEARKHNPDDEYLSFSDEFFEKNCKKLHWFLVQENVYLNERVLEKYAHFLKWERIGSRNHIMTDEFMWKYREQLNWNFVSCNPGLSLETISKFKDFVNWKYICKHQTLTEAFIRQHINKIDPSWVFFKDVSEQFISENIKHFDMKKILCYENFSTKFLQTHVDVLPAGVLFVYQPFLTPNIILHVLNKNKQHITSHGIALKTKNASYIMFSDTQVLQTIAPYISSKTREDLIRVYNLVVKMQRRVINKLYAPESGAMYKKAKNRWTELNKELKEKHFV